MAVELVDEHGKPKEPTPTTHVLMCSAEGSTMAMAFTPDHDYHISKIFEDLVQRKPVFLQDGKLGKLYVPPKDAMIMARVITTREFEKEMNDQRFAMMQAQGRRQ